MQISPLSLLSRALAFALLVATVSACSSSPPPDPTVGQVARPALTAGPQPVAPATAQAFSTPESQGKAVARVFERGTGTLVAQASVQPQANLITTPSGDITLNMVDAEVRDVVRTVLQEALGANYVIDPSVGGRITVQTTKPLPAQDLVAVLDAVLRVNGAALIHTGNLYKVVPIDRALTSGPMPALKPLPRAGTPGFGVQIVPLRFVSAPEMAHLLEPFTPPGGAVDADPTRNLLLLAGSDDQLATLRDLVASFDVDWLKGMSFGLFPLDVAQASEMAQELDQVFGGTTEGPLAGLVRIVPIDRLNSILVISAQSDYLTEAENWIKRLDRVGEGGEARIFVYSVQNGRAANLAQVLSQIFDATTATVGAPSLLAPGLQPIELSSTSPFDLTQGIGQGTPGVGQSTLSGTQPGGLKPPQAMQSSAAGMSAIRPASGNLTRPGAGTTTLSRPGGARPSAATMMSADDEIRIIADDTTNSLVIKAKPREYRKIREALGQLDILPLQVLIEATIAEVTLNNELRYGIEWFFHSGDFDLSFSSRVAGAVTPLFPGFSALFAGKDARVLLTALEDITDVNVVSSPQVVVLDNQTAQLQVGDQVPILTQQSQSVTNPDAPIVNSVEQVQTGVVLNVTPRVNASGLVMMEIQQQVSDAVQTTTSQIDSPTIRQRQVASTVAIQSGQTVALGGLIQDNKRSTQSGLPFLSRLPVIGWLFGTTDKRNDRTELLVLLTPTVIGSQEQARAVTQELQRRLRSVAPLTSR
jgi:general secretion pathway protein D